MPEEKVTNVGKPDESSIGHLADTLRTMLKHEAEVTNHRMTWLGTFQGFLFAAFGFSYCSATPKRGIAMVFCGLGIATALLSIWGLCLAQFATWQLLKHWWKYRKTDYTGAPLIGIEPPEKAGMKFFTPWVITVFMFALAWSGLLAIVYLN